MKSVRIEAKHVNGCELVYAETLQGVKNKIKGIVNAMKAVDKIEDEKSEYVIRAQTVGAKGWVVYSYLKGNGKATKFPPSYWDEK